MVNLFIKVWSWRQNPKAKHKWSSTSSQFWKKNSNQGIFFRSSLLLQLQSISTTLQTLSVFVFSIPNFSLSRVSFLTLSSASMASTPPSFSPSRTTCASLLRQLQVLHSFTSTSKFFFFLSIYVFFILNFWYYEFWVAEMIEIRISHFQFQLNQ